jgi:hypothetical protein
MLYTIIYDFMWRDLRLRGAEKEVFAVIYGFWKKGKAAVEVPVKTVMDITGLSRTAVLMAKRNLLGRKLIAAHETRGKPSRYVVLIPDPCENNTGTESERKPVQNQNGYRYQNNTCAETAPKINNNKKNNKIELNYGTYTKNESNCISSRGAFDTADKE